MSRPVEAQERWRGRSGVSVDLIQDDEWPRLRAFEAAAGRGELLGRPTFQWLRRVPDRASSLSPSSPKIWVAKKDGQVIGRQAAIPFTLLVEGEAVEAFWAIDLLVDTTWRLKGVGPMLMNTLTAQRPIVLAMGMTEAARRMYRRAGWLDVGPIPRWARPLRPARMTAHHFGLDAPGPWAAALDGAFAAADRGLAAFERLRGYRLERIRRFDGRVQDISAKVCTRYGAIGERDHGFLRWRFDDAPDADRHVRYYLTRRGQPVGYAVVRHATGDNGPFLEILDCVAEPGDLAPLLRLLMVSDAARDALAVHCTMLNRPARRRLRLVGFVPRVPDLRLMVHLRDDARHLEPVVGDPHSWLITAADGDCRIGRPGE